jgi:pilus assembly protein CpaB
MKAARIVVLVVAVGAGGVAAFLASRSDPPPPVPQQAATQIDSVDVLVANNDIGVGRAIASDDVKWQAWPKDAAGSQLIRRADRPTAIETIVGSVTRTPFLAGEPIREEKLIKAGGSGFLAAILPTGMRAIATEITPETGVGGFVLPNDRVDVLLTRSEKADVGEIYVSETVLTNVRVLAIDQSVEEKQGQRVAVGKIATLELSPRQAESLQVARRFGTLSLVLRSLVDSTTRPGEDDPNSKYSSRESISLVRFGRTTTTLK